MKTATFALLNTKSARLFKSISGLESIEYLSPDLCTNDLNLSSINESTPVLACITFLTCGELAGGIFIGIKCHATRSAGNLRNTRFKLAAMSVALHRLLRL